MMSMSPDRPHIRQLVDWRAAILAGMVGAVVLMILEIFFTRSAVGSGWVFPRMLAAVVLGPKALVPKEGFDVGVLAAALLVHLPLSIAFGCLIAFVIHKGGLVGGVLGGAFLGLCLYWINFGTVFNLVPWFAPMKSLWTMWAHVVFGAVCGGVYEALEVEKFVVETPVHKPAERGA
jgi:hypothetical protein